MTTQQIDIAHITISIHRATRDSKSGLSLSLLLDMLDVKYKHNYPLCAQGHFYMADFFFPDSQDFHEYMGMLDHEQYTQQTGGL